MHTVAYNAFLLIELQRVLEVLQARDIPVIVLKGPVLGQLLCRDPALRPMGDLDLLLRREDRERISKILQDLGYALETQYGLGHTLIFLRQFGAEVMARRDMGQLSVHLDLHEHLINVEWIRRASAVDIECLWSEAQPFCLDGIELAQQLGPEHLLIHLCIHWAAHGFTGWGRGRELAQVVRVLPLDWDRLIKQARTFRVSIAVYWALFLAGQASPSSVLRALRPTCWRRQLLMKLAGPERVARFDEGPADKARFLMHLALVDRWQDMLKVVRFVFLPEPEWVRERYCLSSHWQVLTHYPKHWGRMFCYGCRAIIQAARL